MIPDQHPDPFGEAALTTVRDVLKVGSILTAYARVVLIHKARAEQLRAEKDRQVKQAIRAQALAEKAAARLQWAPVNDPAWLRQAGLVDIAQAWAAAVPYADASGEWYEAAAASAVRDCENKLRQVHPYAMTRYDRLRAEGMTPFDAMRETVHLFGRPPTAYQQSAAPRAALGPGAALGHSWGAAVHGPSRADFEAEQHKARGAAIVGNLQARAAHEGRPPLTEDEQSAALAATTNLPPAIISQVAAAPAAGRRAARRRPWLQDFPYPIGEVLAAAAARHDQAPTAAATGRAGREAEKAPNRGRGN